MSKIAEVFDRISRSKISYFVTVLYVLFRLKFLNFAPLWDGKYYHDLLVQTVYKSWNIMDYAISGHSSIFFLYLFGLVERFFPGNVAVFNLALIFWGALGVWAFCEILEILFADKGSKFELLIFDLVFAFHPAVLASCLNFNVDQGVLVCFLLYLRSYLKSEFLSACF